MKTILRITKVFTLCIILASQCAFSQNTNIDNLLNQTTWNSIFPNRAGLATGHPQGYTTDFFSFSNFKQAVDEMSDYIVKIRLKNGVWGQVITVNRRSTNTTYNYQDADAFWYSSTVPETIINVDFKDFANRTSDVNNRRELGAFLANISKETTGGWQTPVGGGSGGDYAKWGLYFVYEVGYNSSNAAGAYSQAHAEYPPNPTQGYYGRGPIQLSWNYNYGQFSKFIYNDKNILLNNPNLIQTDGVLAFKSAIWFWMMPQCPKPSCHQVMHELFNPQSGIYTSTKMYKKGFAHTNNIINGGLECRAVSTSAYTQKVVLRSGLYKFYLSFLGLSSAQIDAEDQGNYSTLCYDTSTNAMQDYQSCDIQLSASEFEIAKFSIQPNPASNQIKISHTATIEKIEIFNALGKIVKTEKTNALEASLDVSGLTDGLYFVKIYSGDSNYTRRMLINK